MMMAAAVLLSGCIASDGDSLRCGSEAFVCSASMLQRWGRASQRGECARPAIQWYRVTICVGKLPAAP
jgi:hypothetical protein